MSGFVVYTDIPAASSKFVFDTRQLAAARTPPQLQVKIPIPTAALTTTTTSTAGTNDILRSPQTCCDAQPLAAAVDDAGVADSGTTCPGCWGQYSRTDGQMPKSLDCLHIVCSKCITVHVSKSSKSSGRKYPCPVCQQVTKLPKGGARDMLTHRVTLEQVDIVSAARKKKATTQQETPAVVANATTTIAPAAVNSPTSSSAATTATPALAASFDNNTFYQIGRNATIDIRTTIPQSAAFVQPAMSIGGGSNVSAREQEDNADDIDITSNSFYQMGVSEAAAEANTSYRPSAHTASSSSSSSRAVYAAEKRPEPYNEKAAPIPSYQDQDLPPPYSPPAVFTPPQALYPLMQGDTETESSSVAITTDPNNPHVITSGGVSYWRMFPEGGGDARLPSSLGTKGGEARRSVLPPSIMRPSGRLPGSARVTTVMYGDGGGQQSSSYPNLSAEIGDVSVTSSSSSSSSSSAFQRRNSLPGHQPPSPLQTEEANPLPPCRPPNPSLVGLSFVAGFGAYGEVKMKAGRFRAPTRVQVSDADEVLVVDEQYATVHVFGAQFQPLAVIQLAGVRDACFFGLDKIVAATGQGVQVVYTNGRLLRDLPIGPATGVAAHNLGFVVSQPQKLVVYSQVIEVVKETGAAKSGKIVKTTARKFKSLSAVAVAKNGRHVAVLDASGSGSSSQEIILLDGASLLLVAIIRPEQQPCGPLKNATALAIDGAGRLFVVDAEGGRVLQFSATDGSFARSLLTIPADDLACAGPVLPRGVACQNPDLVLVTLAGEHFAQTRVYRLLPGEAQ